MYALVERECASLLAAMLVRLAYYLLDAWDRSALFLFLYADDFLVSSPHW